MIKKKDKGKQQNMHTVSSKNNGTSTFIIAGYWYYKDKLNLGIFFTMTLTFEYILYHGQKGCLTFVVNYIH